MSLKFLAPLLRPKLARDVTQAVLLAMQPEAAHRATITALKMGAVPVSDVADPPELAVSLLGMNFPNPVGMAAGFDKNGEVPDALAAIGFGFSEVGTVTPVAQEGNPQPRLFRLVDRDAIINRMGFNNDGHEAVLDRLEKVQMDVPLGVNIGANKHAADVVADYVAGVQQFATVADYLTVNISSPNTPGLRDLQQSEALTRLLDKVLDARAAQARHVPVFLKIAPDLGEAQLDDIATVVLSSSLDGLIISNTSTGREEVTGHHLAHEAGGLSGRPIFTLTTRRLAQMRLRVGPEMPIIGVGGVHSAYSAIAKFEAGANLIQLYSALVYSGMDLLQGIKAGLVAEVRKAGLQSVSELSGRAVADWAKAE